ncbi:MAG: type II secretion system protein, partial [Armatimonadota bacterium]
MVPSVTIFDRPTAKNGFALVELLIVMAIVTVLVAVAVPVTIQARSRARMAACLSNLRQLGDALSAYSQDWEDKLPRLAGRPFAGSWPSAEWPEGSSATHMRRVLMRYARNAEVFRCGDDVGSPEYGYDGRSGPVYSRAGTSYLPWSTVRAGRYGVAINGVQTSQITRLSSIVLLRDYGSDWHGYLTRNGLSTEAVTVANAAYADGHSASVRIYSAGISGRTYVCWATGS